jgi:predicted esterase
MKRWLTALAALVLVSLPALAQDARKIEELNRKAIDALMGKHYDEGIALLKQVLELQPKDKGSAYNLACAYSLKGEVDPGFEWLGKACDWGWGAGVGQLAGQEQQKKISEIEMCRTDADLELLRKDARFEPLMVKMQANADKRKALNEKGAAYASTPAIYVPAAIKDLPEKPLLVVVHDAGSTKEQVVAGFWKQVADELGFALVAPSGKVLLKDEPAQGMAWYEDLNVYADPNESWKSEKTIHEAVAAFKKTSKVDSSRVVLVGEGQIGAMVAFSTGISNPGLYKAVLGVDGGFAPQMIASKTANSAKLGQKAKVLYDLSSSAGADEATKKDLDSKLATLKKALEEPGLGTLATYNADPKDPKVRQAKVVEALKALTVPAAPKPAEAGAPK